MITRTGKVARFPTAIRELLNQKLREGLDANAILPWLNSLPEVKSVLAEQFAGLPVNEMNLSSWRTGGFKDWLRRREALEFLESISEAPPPGSDTEAGPPPEYFARYQIHKLMRWLVTQYAAAAARIATLEDTEERWVRLRQLCADMSKLTSVDLNAESLRLESERLDLAHARVSHNLFCLDRPYVPPTASRVMAGTLVSGSKRPAQQAAAQRLNQPGPSSNSGPVKPDKATQPAEQPKIKPNQSK
jgi:hypothetical protein